MAKGLEHLSDAQIENYGTENFSEDSHAPDVEAHLEDCDDCRNRLLEHHRARFGLLTDAARQGVTNSASSSQLGAFTKSAVTKPSGQDGYASVDAGVCSLPNGPSEDDLRNLAADLIAPDKALAITQHAAQCTHCGPMLRAFTEEFSDDQSAGDLKAEHEALSQLKSSTPKWQKEVAGEAVKSNRDRSAMQHVEAKPYRWSMRWVLAPAAIAATALIAFSLWFTQRDTPEKVEKLLAQAYTEHRTMEYRWPGAEWGPMRVTRGAGESHLSRPATQLEAERILAEHQGSDSADTSKNPKWLTVKAEAELLNNQPQPAITDLAQALSANPGSSDVELMLAIAYAQQGDKLNDSASWEKALDILDRILLRKVMADEAALFNRALVYQRLNMPEKARADFDALRKWEHQPSWKPEDEKKGSGSN